MFCISVCACLRCALTANVSVCAVVEYNLSCFHCVDPKRVLEAQVCLSVFLSCIDLM